MLLACGVEHTPCFIDLRAAAHEGSGECCGPRLRHRHPIETLSRLYLSVSYRRVHLRGVWWLPSSGARHERSSDELQRFQNISVLCRQAVFHLDRIHQQGQNFSFLLTV
ncbi:hypothetical protein SKAU_G00256850 [Synaphobranchus kaupii]|uniref:Uncharacterized protein n=1 Tax=Synaphobranchus kaupii TaxID=118154 RepID=A0A9Q1ISE9_SYNKA|nr:hypothetical protein SKAU_G00256850 [Synaphobranchus kaupii]